MTAEKKLPKSGETAQELDRIRDIIFGSQMRTYEGDFQTIHSDLERLQQELDRLNEKLAEQEKEYKEKLQAHEREMRKANDNLRNELRETARKLTTDKVDRQGLGDLLIELGGHLKTGGSLADTLKDVLAPEKD
jgi:uncharacterized protein YukE